MRHVFLCVHTLAFLATIVSCFDPRAGIARLSARTPPTSLCSSPKEQGGKEATRSTGGRGGTNQERTLYDVLNASPNDSHQLLRSKYTEAARLTHPDATVGVELQEDNAMGDFREIAAAWSVLSDPRERRRYDRSLKAKELTDSMGSLIETGFNVAAPFLFETAPQQINKTASDIGKTIFDVGERLDKARTETEQRLQRAAKIAALNRKSSDMALRAANEAKRGEALKARLYSDRRLALLQNDDSELTSVQASNIIEGFEFIRDGDSSTKSITKAIGALAEVEIDHKERIYMHQNNEKILSTAEKDVQSAKELREKADAQLEESSRRLGDALVSREVSEKTRKEAIQKETQASTTLDKAELSMSSARQKEQLAREAFEEARRRFEDARAVREQSEETHREAALQRERAKVKIDMAEQEMGSATLGEKTAKDRLEESRRGVEESLSAIRRSEKYFEEAALQEKQSAANRNEKIKILKRQQRETKQVLRQAEGLNNSKENSYLREESERLEKLSAKLRAKAEKLRAQAEELKRQNE
uniref:J domain-containing protein n=1 Tax=Odontella aurita TaxID=265563 RepID=A0A7S4JNN3_9STRA|mmetsp:Transcript_50268/g.151342  ORF Transcript_50268/g.151342 Transcript_50268/m.151342 type:complete len:534 (+) Transcript_50268:171-1772(+)